MTRLKLCALLSSLVVLGCLSACTPEYAQQQGTEFANQARVLDSISLERQNQRLISRQLQICLLSANGGDDAGAELLRSMQAGFSGYFLSTSVYGESVDYIRAVTTAPCPGSSLLFYVEPGPIPQCGDGVQCSPTDYTITIVSIVDKILVDRLKISIRKSFLPLGSEHERRQKAFEQLAIALTGGR